MCFYSCCTGTSTKWAAQKWLLCTRKKSYQRSRNVLSFFLPPKTQLFLENSKTFTPDFCVFWVLEAAIGKFKETLDGIKVVYGTYEHFRSVMYETWSYYVYFIAVKPSLTATFLVIAASRDFDVFWIFEAARCKSKETVVGIKVVYGTYKHFRRNGAITGIL